MSTALPMRETCRHCGNNWGFIEKRGPNDAFFCSECGKWVYHAPKEELNPALPSKRRMPSEKAIREHWREWLANRTGEYDDSPSYDPDGTKIGLCFACKMYRPYCERAHIVARCNGGPDSVENLHMLCKVCHAVSEYMEVDEYWAWLDDWTLEDFIWAQGYLVAPHIAYKEHREFVEVIKREARGAA